MLCPQLHAAERPSVMWPYANAMHRTFLLFLGVGVSSWLLFEWTATADADWLSSLSFVAVIFAPAIAAALWWHQKPSLSFWPAALGVIASGLIGYGIFWWLHVRTFFCPPGDFECLTVGSQSGESLLATVLISVLSILAAAAGAFAGARSAPETAT